MRIQLQRVFSCKVAFSCVRVTLWKRRNHKGCSLEITRSFALYTLTGVALLAANKTGKFLADKLLLHLVQLSVDLGQRRNVKALGPALASPPVLDVNLLQRKPSFGALYCCVLASTSLVAAQVCARGVQ